MSVYITGDTHGELQMRRLSGKAWPEGRSLTKNDYVIIAGDFGLIWSATQSESEKYWIDWLTNRQFTTLFIDGNHENHFLLNKLPIVDKFDGKVGVVNDSIFHLKRGEIYTIANKKFFTMGGAESIDKIYRTLDVSWWKEEVPSKAEMDYAIDNLIKNKWTVDFIVAHTLPKSIVDIMYTTTGWDMGHRVQVKDPTQDFLEYVCNGTKFERLFCGHFHEDKVYDKYTILWNNIIKII